MTPSPDVIAALAVIAGHREQVARIKTAIGKNAIDWVALDNQRDMITDQLMANEASRRDLDGQIEAAQSELDAALDVAQPLLTELAGAAR